VQVVDPTYRCYSKAELFPARYIPMISMGSRFDVGEKLGFVKITLQFALQQDDLKYDLLQYMEHLIKENSKV
jgi:UTP-glucose-1-phosphate uridylyltransferase